MVETVTGRGNAGRFAILAGVCALGSGLYAQTGPYLDISVKGDLRQETRDAISRLMDRRPVARFIEVASREAIPLAELCAPERGCDSGAESDLTEALSFAKALTDSGASALPTIATREMVSYREENAIHGDPVEYAVVAVDDPLFDAVLKRREAAGRETNPTEPLAVPLNTDPLLRKEVAAGGRVALEDPPSQHKEWTTIYLANKASDASVSFGTHKFVVAMSADKLGPLETIEADVSQVGTSQRRFHIADLTPAEKDELVRLLSADPAAVAASNDDSAFTEFVHPPGFETAGACQSVPGDWPFDSTAVKEILTFNQKVLVQVGLGPPTPTRLLVVDTGLSAALNDDPRIRPALHADPEELLASAEVFTTDQKTICLDWNGSGFFGDIYGSSSSNSSASCRDASFPFGQLSPIKARPAAPQTYWPDHGGFVAALALGGPSLLAEFGDIRRFVGLRIFRVPQEADPGDPLNSVRVDESDWEKAMKFAIRSGVDIVQISAKAEDRRPFETLLADSDALLVTSAGNDMENLGAEHANFPASMQDNEDRILVVGALQPGQLGPEPWPNSAFSEELVDIAAPGARIESLAADGMPVCQDGTSAAAPLVSFVAAVLKAHGMSSMKVVQARILGSSARIPKLKGKVRHERALDVPSALDVFVDQVWITGVSGPLRGWIQHDQPHNKFQACKRREPFTNDPPGVFDPQGGSIDLSSLWSWTLITDGPEAGSVRADHRRGAREDFRTGHCQPPSGTFKFKNFGTGSEDDVNWSRVRRIVPTPFRAVKEAAFAVALSN